MGSLENSHLEYMWRNGRENQNAVERRVRVPSETGS
jgi:hypothetical protein